MGSIFRSEKVYLGQLFIQPEAGFNVISELGEKGIVQFRDLSENVNAQQRRFVSEVRRCDEMERKIRFIETELKRDNFNIPDCFDLPKALHPKEMIDLEAHLEKFEGDIKEMNESSVKLKSNYLELVEMRHVLEKSQSFFSEGTEDIRKILSNDEILHPGTLTFVSGVINRDKLNSFERMLWRVSRGNVFIKQAEIEEGLEDPQTRNEIFKNVFVAFFQGEQLKSRVKKVCSGFHASLYPCPESSEERQSMLTGLKTRLADINLVLNQTQDHRTCVLTNMARDLKNWKIQVCKMKAIYHTLNFFSVDISRKCLVGECWIPKHDLQTVQKILQEASSASGSFISSFLNVIDTFDERPTFNRTNKFTRGFQNLIDAYGISNYREVNPALYTIITFPFLFAVMFGDIGHGAILFLFSLYMVISEKKILSKKISSEMFDIIFSGRYIILLMGIFSIYTGFIYNDIFSKSMHIFPTSWSVNYNESTVFTNEGLQLNPDGDFNNEAYPFGLDPVWQLASNKIIFLNSFKMKLSIIIGVVHMMFGVLMSIVNYIQFRKYSSIFLEFLPQIIFLSCLFLWMVIMMFFKWVLYSTETSDLAFQPGCAPSVLILFINMMLFKHTKPEDDHCLEFMFEQQPLVQQILIFIALACVPIMLLGKPFYIMCCRRISRKKAGHNKSDSHEEEEEMSEIFIHQGIHTIEYVLNTVSHTASYLRLWALSLAHAQLSEVLWSMVLRIGLQFNSYVGAAALFLTFAIWAVFTLGILVIMEGLSAFLHTLRLHWVEFMSKFFTGLGYLFEPFSFKNILELEETKEEGQK